MQKRILIVSQEISPYTAEGHIGESALELAKVIKKNKGAEIRLFMPKYGCVNERRHQLHEVIRLSGVNIVVNDIDQPLIVKVASIPQARLQVYFIDNDEYFQSKRILTEKNKSLVKDNDERMIFFCRGVLETLQMLGWSPDIIHCHGWFTSLLPVYLKEGADDDGNKLYYNHPVFKNTKIISSFHNEGFTGSLNKSLVEKMKFDGFEDSLLENLKTPNHQALISLASRFSDGIVFESEYKNDEQLKLAYKENTPVLESADYTQYYNFYQNFFSEELV
ncbi:MAG: glycogen synthase [Flavobacteriales bacterium]|nr:glycogen synthase [Flavobacteriales bacterium]|tara:strand:- start:646 stop:1476 length:831 start_codon:yes stop_codon:yes gene_type:complete